MKVSLQLFKQAARNARLVNRIYYLNKHNALVKFDDKRQSLVVAVMNVHGQVSTFVPVLTFDGNSSVSVTVDAQELWQVVRALTGDVVKVEQSKDGLILSDYKASYLIAPCEHPVVMLEYSESEISGGFVIEDVKSFLHEMQCSGQCSGSLFSLRCVYIRLSDQDQRIVVTGLDNHRLRERTLGAKVTGRCLLAIDKDNAKMMARVFKDKDAISVKVAKTMMILESEEVTVICKLIEVKKPNLQMPALPYKVKCVASYNIIADAKQLCETAKRLAYLCWSMNIDFYEKKLLSMNPHLTSLFYRVPYAIGNPPPFSIVVDARHFAEVLEGIEGDVKIEIGPDDNSPIVFCADGYRAVLMTIPKLRKKGRRKN